MALTSMSLILASIDETKQKETETYLYIPKDLRENYKLVNGVILICLVLSGAIFYSIFLIIARKNSALVLLWAIQSNQKDRIALDLAKKS